MGSNIEARNIGFLGSGTLEFSEFLTMLPQVKRSGDTEDEVEEAFRVFDKEGNGQINASELRYIILQISQSLWFIVFA